MSLKQYSGHFISGFKSSIEYKSDLIGNLVYGIIRLPILYLVWEIIFPFIKDSFFTFKELLLYYFLYVVISTFETDILTHIIADDVKEGNIITTLIKPTNFILLYFFFAIGERLLTILLTISLFVISSIVLSFQINYFMLFLYLIPFLLFNFLFSIIKGLLSFWFTEIWGINSAIDSFTNLFNGGFIPLYLYPLAIQDVLKFTPFYHEFYRYALSVLGKISFEQSLFSISIIFVWCVIFFFIIKFMMRKGKKKLEGLGG